MNVITYKVGNGLYVNMTNRCSNACEFCIRINNDNANGSEEEVLWLDEEPSKEAVLADVLRHDLDIYDELVFCGFGEPSYRIEDISWLLLKIKEKSDIKIRINTNGQANLIHGRDVSPLFKGFDIVSISLNEKSAEKYQAICHSEFGEEAFPGILDFAKKVKAYAGEVVLSVVDVLPKEDIEECRRITESVGVTFRVRSYIN